MFTKLLEHVALGAKNLPQRRFFAKSFYPIELFGKIGVVGVPFGKGQKKKGKDEVGLKIAPDFLRNTGFLKQLECLGMDIMDYGNICYEPDCHLSQKNMFNLDHFAPCIKQVSESVAEVLTGSRSCLVLGGDHSIATGSIFGHMSVAGPKEVALIYVDAHADINTDSTSPSGCIHGMTIALLAQELRDQWPDCGIPGLDWMEPCLSLRNIAYIGTRSVDDGEAKFLRDNRVAVFSMEDIGRCGIHRALCRAVNQIDPNGCKSYHLSFDIDALDYAEAPCTTVPERGGLTLREGIDIAETLFRTGRLSVVDLVEVNPAIGTEIQRQITLDAAKQILLASYGYCRRGNPKP